MSTDLATNRIAEMNARIRQMQEQFALAAPRGVEARQVVRDSMTLIRNTPDLLLCEPTSVLGGLMTFAQLGLRPGVPNLGHGWLIPFRDKRRGGKLVAQLVIGYQGLAELAYRSGQIEMLTAHVVHEHDHLEMEYGLDERLVHRPKLNGDRGPVIGYYAAARIKGGGESFYYMTRDEAEVYRDRYAMAQNGPWKSEFDKMAMKSCVRQLSKLLPKGTDLQVGLAVDNSFRLDVRPDADLVAVSTVPQIQSAPQTPSAVDEWAEPEDVDMVTGEVRGAAPVEHEADAGEPTDDLWQGGNEPPSDDHGDAR